ncbi:MAG: SH3 domain-containing protein [Planctomycetaceae bacterium]|nr:SH3 domain-containing protein [Planctomycetaceae bacterium]
MSDSASAAEIEFPYEAVVQSDNVVVRKGPGERYDPTMKLSTGERVTVHRHDPGGWYVISPPPGSFSWINASYVETSDDGRGIVTVPPTGDGLPPRVAVYVGSQFNNEHNVINRQLTTGDEVTIIGEKTQPTTQGPTKFYKIEPPRLENRWVKGDYVLPLSEVGNLTQFRSTAPPAREIVSPFDEPITESGIPASTSASPGFPVVKEETPLERELIRAIDSNAAVKSGTPAPQLERDRAQLRQLDQQMRNMLAQNPGAWSLDAMERSYRDLQASASPGVAGMIDARLETLAARQKIKSEYDAFMQVTTKTDIRDAELLSLQNPEIPTVQIDTGPVQLGQPQSMPVQLGQPIGSETQPFVDGNLQVPPVGDVEQVDVAQLDGAGIVARMPRPQPGLPTYALVAPDGRLLAYLQADQGVNLDAYLGKSMGVVGKRTHEPQLQSDLIVVRQLTPVRLEPPTQGGS